MIKIKKGTIWVSNSILSRERKNSQYKKPKVSYKKAYMINEFTLSKTGNTGIGQYTVFGIQNNRIIFKSVGHISIDFIFQKMYMYETPFSFDDTYTSSSPPRTLTPIVEFVSGNLQTNGDFIEAYAAVNKDGDLYNEIVEYKLIDCKK
jgi:hypothetical protein